MCAVSMIFDHYNDQWHRKLVKHLEQEPPKYIVVPKPTLTQEEIDEFHRLLERAREYDKKYNQPDCELEGKKETIRKLAKELGVEDILKLKDETNE